MASVYDVKPKFQGLLRPLVGSLATRGVTANQVTLLAAFFSILLGVLIYLFPYSSWPLLCIPPFLFFRMALNAIDGMLAREHDMQSSLGALLNELGDVVSDSALYLPLAMVPLFDSRLVVIIVVLSAVSEMAGVVAVQIGSMRRYEGPMGKSDRAFWIGLLSLLAGLGLINEPWMTISLTAISALLILTIFNRGSKALKES